MCTNSHTLYIEVRILGYNCTHMCTNSHTLRKAAAVIQSKRQCALKAPNASSNSPTFIGLLTVACSSPLPASTLVSTEVCLSVCLSVWVFGADSLVSSPTSRCNRRKRSPRTSGSRIDWKKRSQKKSCPGIFTT